MKNNFIAHIHSISSFHKSYLRSRLLSFLSFLFALFSLGSITGAETCNANDIFSRVGPYSSLFLHPDDPTLMPCYQRQLNMLLSKPGADSLDVSFYLSSCAGQGRISPTPSNASFGAYACAAITKVIAGKSVSNEQIKRVVCKEQFKQLRQLYPSNYFSIERRLFANINAILR